MPKVMSSRLRRLVALGAAVVAAGAVTAGLLVSRGADAVSVALGVLLALGLSTALAWLAIAQLAQRRTNAFLVAEARVQAAERGARTATQQTVARVARALEQDIVSKADLRRLEQRLVKATDDDVAQLEAYIQLLQLVPPTRPMPRTRGWAASPDLLLTVVEAVLAKRPGLVVDIGSGLTTVWEGMALQRLGTGRVVALDHDESWAAETAGLIERQSISEQASVRYAPLTPQEVEGRQVSWYDPVALADLDGIDVLVVDGPPGTTGPLARFPAVPLLWDRLAKDAVIILDDADRDDEKAVVDMWVQAFPDLHAVHLRHEKGAVVLSRTPVGR